MEQDDARDEKGRWKKGHTGNSNGRPASGSSYPELFEKYGDEIDPETELPRKEAVVKLLYDIALKEKSLPALKYIFDRTMGTPTQSLEHTVFQEENPLVDVLRQIVDGSESEAD